MVAREGNESEGKGQTVKGHEAAWWDGRDVLYHDCGPGYVTFVNIH